MYAINLISIPIILFILTASSYFDAPTPLLNWRHELTKVNSIQQIEDSLSSKRMPMRVSAVLRLTELGSSISVSALIKAYKDEPAISTGIVDAGPGVRYLILRALGRIGGHDSYVFLKNLSYELTSQSNKVWSTQGDASYIIGGLYDALAKLEPPDSAMIYYEIFKREDINEFSRQVAFEAYERINLKNANYTTFQDSLYHLLDENRNLHVTKQLDSNYKETPEFTARKAIRYLIEVYTNENPEIVERYKSTLTMGDTFNAEVDFMITLMRSKTAIPQHGIQK